MYELEKRLKGLVQKVGEVVLDLLSTLNVHEFVRDTGETVEIFLIDILLLLVSLDFETHIAANATKILVLREVLVHRKDGVIFGLEPNIKQDYVLRVEFLAEPVEEPIVGGKLSSILIFYCVKEIEKNILFIFIFL